MQIVPRVANTVVGPAHLASIQFPASLATWYTMKKKLKPFVMPLIKYSLENLLNLSHERGLGGEW